MEIIASAMEDWGAELLETFYSVAPDAIAAA